MLKRQHTEGNLDDGVMDTKRSRVEEQALVAVPTEKSQQLIIAETNNKVMHERWKLTIIVMLVLNFILSTAHDTG